MVTWGAPSRGGLALLAASLALTQAAIFPRQSSEAPRAWVTVEADGATKTITPTVNDGKTTSAFPGNTALPTAEAQGGGAFVLCNPAAGSGGLAQPFCAPAKDNQVEGGKTYFVTWDASLFPSTNTVVQVQGDYGVTSTIKEPGHGFSSLEIPASAGFFEWAVLGYDMPAGEAMDVQLFLAIPAANGSIVARNAGPKVRVISNNRTSINDPVRRKVNVLGIVLPIVFGVLSLCGIGWFVWWYGRRKGMFASRSQGYGIGKSRGQRTDGLRLADGTFTSANRGGVEMMPPPRPPPPSTGNAFRDELNRQERNNEARSDMM
ncbi:hypothetical protein COL154_011974 [Colletotrichum chrysophilum]|uniref:uncharacterized protein n=1 Tax=Colletotrichum chrysophilum TaxID=1836956 RepID=UPI002301505D|nr:uncharacterized protein COL26b_012303 [Colletotrichum chrysophilum]KAI8245871.1 hypothetical protein K4K55_000136 [Colletotrichum sp. SAR 10_96]KAI8296484.1 hypothetical protein K4K56_003691 [Colletotrichum sp. SAR 10_98]KAJ5019411.1 hypothetical protein K4K57_000577 [Colletotrichum sp. SAR 10_99]KAJ0341079.1 hypothetical protein KNSL1_011269 [Colletotrichum chrysophilum]KAJ0353927.1 hypothetical protein COL154_011974 [Colletotrichum chrysophilum]